MNVEYDFIRIDIKLPGYKKWTYLRPMVDSDCIRREDKWGIPFPAGDPITSDELLSSELLIKSMMEDVKIRFINNSHNAIRED